MGTTIGGIGIKTEVAAYSNEEMLQNLFVAANYTELKEADLYNNDQFKFDNREPDCISIYKTAHAIWIINSDISNDFFTVNSEWAANFFSFFNHPELMLAFNRYDSGGTYGYSIYENGTKIRSSRVISYEKEVDTGSPLSIELDWLNGNTEIEDMGDGEVQKNYINSRNSERICPEELLTEILLEDLLGDYFGISTETLYHKATERSYYRISVAENKPAVKQKWWKKLFS